jgi:hypothetical protein
VGGRAGQPRQPAGSSIAFDDSFADRLAQLFVYKPNLSRDDLWIFDDNRLPRFLDQGSQLRLRLSIAIPSLNALPVSLDDGWMLSQGIPPEISLEFF